MLQYKNLADFLKFSAERFPNNPLFGTKIAGAYKWETYEDAHNKVKKFRSFLKENNITKGDKVAIIAGNSEKWGVCAYAALGLGAVIVPMYEVQNPDDWKFILQSCKAKWAFVANDKIKNQLETFNIPSIERIIVFSTAPANVENDYDAIMKTHTGTCEILEKNPDDLAAILYTSGTTGKPKGVMLTHNNFIYNAVNASSQIEILSEDRCMSFLPWAHAFGLLAELFTFVYNNAAIGFAESAKTIPENLQEVNPTVFLAVPKVFNKFYDVIQKKFESSPKIMRQLIEYTQTLAIRLKSKDNKKASLVEKMQHKVLDKLIGTKIRKAFGNNLRIGISGAAALSREVIEFFDAFGVVILEGYGLTETSPIVCVNNNVNRRFGTVGKPIPTCNIRIEKVEGYENTEQGELITSGPCVMKGYYENDEANAEVFTENGEFKTGDLAFIDEDGYVWITGRVKEQYKLENGKYVVPSSLEKVINNSPYIENSLVVGNDKPYNIVLISPNMESLTEYCNQNAISIKNTEDTANNKTIKNLYWNEIINNTKDFRGYEKPQNFAFIIDPLTIDNGMLTPALKVKRNKVIEKYQTLIEETYKQGKYKQ